MHLYRASMHSASLTFSYSYRHTSCTNRRRCQPCKATISSLGAVGVRCLAQGHVDTWLGGAGDRTSNLLVANGSTLNASFVQLLRSIFAVPTQSNLSMALDKSL